MLERPRQEYDAKVSVGSQPDNGDVEGRYRIYISSTV